MSKRTKLFQLGLCEAETHTDWFFILDGDEVLAEVHQAAGVDALDAYREDGVGVVSATLWEKADPHQSELRTETNMKLATDWRYEVVRHVSGYRTRICAWSATTTTMLARMSWALHG